MPDPSPNPRYSWRFLNRHDDLPLELPELQALLPSSPPLVLEHLAATMRDAEILLVGEVGPAYDPQRPEAGGWIRTVGCTQLALVFRDAGTVLVAKEPRRLPGVGDADAISALSAAIVQRAAGGMPERMPVARQVRFIEVHGDRTILDRLQRKWTASKRRSSDVLILPCG